MAVEFWQCQSCFCTSLGSI